MSSISIEPYYVSTPEFILADLKHRLASVRWPEQETVLDWSQGVPLYIMQDLCHYWQHEYDWRRCESWLNECGQYLAKIDDHKIHFLHIKSSHEHALPMLLMHGWPGSILEFRKVIEPLTEPTAYGGKAEDSFHLVIPSMPGYGFSSKPSMPATNHRRIGELYSRLMEHLGYEHWVAQGGDWGADICAKLATRDPPKSLAGVHINCLFFDAQKEVSKSEIPTDKELLAVKKEQAFRRREYGYFELQATRPQTIGYSLADSPIGQAAWIYEKLHNWSQNDGDLEQVLNKDEILDNITLYWLTNTGASSARLYWEDDDNTALPIDIPVGVSDFPGELTTAPRTWAERYYSNIIYWNETERGGHFAAWEVPEIFVREMRQCFAQLRKQVAISNAS